MTRSRRAWARAPLRHLRQPHGRGRMLDLPRRAPRPQRDLRRPGTEGHPGDRGSTRLPRALPRPRRRHRPDPRGGAGPAEHRLAHEPPRRRDGHRGHPGDQPDVEGEATAAYLARMLSTMGVETSRLAMGLPMGR